MSPLVPFLGFPTDAGELGALELDPLPYNLCKSGKDPDSVTLGGGCGKFRGEELGVPPPRPRVVVPDTTFAARGLPVACGDPSERGDGGRVRPKLVAFNLGMMSKASSGADVRKWAFYYL